jgi:hypothetical protein
MQMRARFAAARTADAPELEQAQLRLVLAQALQRQSAVAVPLQDHA